MVGTCGTPTAELLLRIMGANYRDRSVRNYAFYVFCGLHGAAPIGYYFEPSKRCDGRGMTCLRVTQ